jgi:drug/metabolite transporter (DMT)-like permease
MGGLFIVLFSTGWIAGKFGLLSTGPLTLLLIRFGAAALVLLVVALLTGAPWPRGLAAYGHLAVVGMLMHALAMAGVYLGLSLGVSAGASALIGGMSPIFTALAAGLLLDERVGPAQWSGLAIGLIGVTLVVANRISLASGGWEGYAVTFLAVATFVLGTVYQKKFCSAIDLRTGNLVQFAVAGIAVLLPALRFEGLHAEWDEVLILSSLWLSLVNSIVAIGILFVLLRRGAASRVATLFFLVPPVTAVMGFAAFHETLSPIAVAGFALTAAGVYLGARTSGSHASGKHDRAQRSGRM